MAPTQRKPVYIKPEHHDILRRIAYEQHCNLSDVLDAVLEQVDWEKVEKQASTKPTQRVMERASRSKTGSDKS
ncbi:hypothetical protein [Mastigocladopsis repens]|uniref:hypothetical protein n=1 Tax=Mastigocladopsis repens TaxID=221287 RepID=UPI00036BB3A3|nr:hypothetical protein [Mastigocladopsis repens]